MALKKIRFVWATQPLPDGRWRLGLYNLQQSVDPSRPLPPGGVPSYWKGYLHHTLNISVRGVLRWGCVAAIAAYFAGAALIHTRYERANPHNQVGYLDLVLPTRWSERPRLQGEGFILLAREKLIAGRFNEGFGLLRLGVDKNPGDFAARLDLARLYIAIRLRTQAEKLLLEGFDHGYPGRAYLELVFNLATDGDQPDRTVELCQLARTRYEALPVEARPPEDARWLDEQTVKALNAAKRAPEATALVATRYPETDPFRREITLLGLLDAGDPRAAIAIAELWVAEQPRSPTPLRLLVRGHREAGDFAAMDATLEKLRALDPAKPEALLYAIAQNHLAERDERVRELIGEIIFRHGASPTLYPTLATLLAQLGLREQQVALLDELRDRGMSATLTLIPIIQSDISARDWPAALAHTETMRSARGARLTDFQTDWLETMTRLARACADAGSGNQSAIVEFVADHPGTLRLYRLMIEALIHADRIDTAAQIIALAEGPYPSARYLAEARADIEARRAVITAALPAPAPVIDAASDPLAGLDVFLRAVNQRIQASDTPGALALLASARRAQPAWLVGEEPRLDALELPLRARGDDPLRLQLLVRNTLARDASAPTTLLALARDAHTAGARGNALLIVKEIVRRDPANAEALTQLTTWEPPIPPRSLDVQP